MAFPLIDAHCHLHDKQFRPSGTLSNHQVLTDVLLRAQNARVSHVVSCATHEEDWRVLEQLMEQQGHRKYLTILTAFGIHPWWAQKCTSSSLQLLRNILMRYPAASVGEIGLCKSARGQSVPVNVQEEAFRAQLLLAADLERACVVHCVGYYGKLLAILQEFELAREKLPPVLVLHSFGGSTDVMQSFLKLQGMKIFISLNAKQLTHPTMKKAVACCKNVPLKALLLETDAPYQAPLIKHAEKVVNTEEFCGVPLLCQEESAGVNEPCMVQLALLSAAEIRETPLDIVAAAVYQNSKEAFGITTI